MTQRLAVFTPQIGTFSETFVRRHIENVLPGRTVVVARNTSHPFGGHWTSEYPTLFLDRWQQNFVARALRGVGLSDERFRSMTIARFLRRQNVGAVLGEYLDRFVDFVPLLDALRIPYVVQGHGIDVSAALRLPGMVERYAAYRSARAILTRCDFHRRRLVEIGLPAERIMVNPGGIDVPARVPARGPKTAKRFLAIGRMQTKKGPLYLLEAFRLCAVQDPDVSLDYVGDGDLYPAVKQFVSATGLADRVRIHVAIGESAKMQLFHDCGIFVQHSVTDPETGDEEGLPAAIQEAMANGMAVVSTRHSGIPEAVEDGVTGLLVSEGDAIAMADAMMRLSRSEDWRRLGENGREKARRLYTWPAERARLLRHLAPAEILAGETEPAPALEVG